MEMLLHNYTDSFVRSSYNISIMSSVEWVGGQGCIELHIIVDKPKLLACKDGHQLTRAVERELAGIKLTGHAVINSTLLLET